MEQLQIQKFKAFMKERGYINHTIKAYSDAIGILPDGIDKLNEDALYEHINNELALNSNNMTLSVFHSYRAALHLYFLMLTEKTVREYGISAKKPESYDELLREFYEYSVSYKNITVPSAHSECQHVKCFLENLGSFDQDDLSSITAYDVRDYVCNCLTSIQTSSKGRYVTSLRNFFRFLDYKGIQINTSVLNLPLSPAEWDKGNIPVTLSTEEEIKLREFHSGDNPKDKRNHAIVLLLLDFGLRCSEVSELRIPDIQWKKGTLLIQNTKTRSNRELPLSDVIGKALEEYIIHYRPHSENDHVFLRIGGSGNGKQMQRESIRSVVRYAFKREDIHGWWKGTHALRRTAASRLYNSGCGLKLTADMLGHASLDSTTEYVKINFTSLRMVDTCWPEGDDYDEI